MLCITGSHSHWDRLFSSIKATTKHVKLSDLLITLWKLRKPNVLKVSQPCLFTFVTKPVSYLTRSATYYGTTRLWSTVHKQNIIMFFRRQQLWLWKPQPPPQKKKKKKKKKKRKQMHRYIMKRLLHLYGGIFCGHLLFWQNSSIPPKLFIPTKYISIQKQ